MSRIRWRKHSLHGGGPPYLKVGKIWLYARMHLERFKIQREADAAKRDVVARRGSRFREKLRAALEGRAA